MKLKIAFICEALGGGVRKHLVDLLENLNRDKYELHVIHGTERMDAVFIAAKNQLEDVFFYPVSEMVREINLKKDIKSIGKISKILKLINPDIVHCHSSKAGVVGRIAAKNARIKKIYYTPHGYSFQDPNVSKKKMLLYKCIEKGMASKFTTKVIHVSNGEELFAVAKNVVKEKKSAVIYNGMTVNSVYESKKKVTNELHVVTIARMDDQKNPWEAIKIVEGIIRKNKNIKYTYVGDGKYLNEIKEYVTNNGLQDKIFLPGFLKNPLEILKDADLFLLTSLYEGLPYALIEAMAFNLPLIASNVTGNNEIIKQNYNGLLYNTGDISDGIKKLELLLENRDLLRDMSINSGKVYTENFTVKEMIGKYEKLYT